MALFCALLLAVRFVVFPRVEDYRDDLTAALSRQLQQPVEIDRLATGWDGWNPKLVIHGFRVRTGAAAASSPLLDLPQVELVVAWTSLPLLDLRLKSSCSGSRDWRSAATARACCTSRAWNSTRAASATPRRSPSGCCGNRTSRCTRRC